MFEIHRDCLQNKYFKLSVRHCPYTSIYEASKLGEKLVAVENYNADATNHTPKKMHLGLSQKSVFEISVRSLSCNFDTTREYFLKMLNELNEPSFYAVFHKKPLKFTATILEDIPRYRALDNFGWNLEISTPNNSIEYAFFTSPDKTLIDKIEILFK